MANLARAYVVSGERSEAVKLLNELKARSNLAYSNAAEIAMIYASLGDTDQAVAWLEKGYDERFNPGVLLRPGFDPLRTTLASKTFCAALASPGKDPFSLHGDLAGGKMRFASSQAPYHLVHSQSHPHLPGASAVD